MRTTQSVGENVVPRIAVHFMILEHYLMPVENDLTKAKQMLMDLEGIKEFADAGYFTISDYQARQMQTAGLHWIKGADEQPSKATMYREQANQMLKLLSA